MPSLSHSGEITPVIPPGATTGAFPQSSIEIKPVQTQRQLCRIVRQTAWEMYGLFSGEPLTRRNCRHAMIHIRQIAIYVCHVGLSIPAAEVALCFGRDAATIRTSCGQVEERREERGFDDFVSTIERLAKSISQILEVNSHDRSN